ncbi:hypothetical protein JVT61DRAFT_167 [Boletus reticuloceps]|uniref:Uncharacterized protein n=1 Tax=Boletus reticuloceps TaxID=495285 RepID=A0A8I3AFJ4_9AGAM|nr:hypothetical protein JVT61DRAFT_167 [Boletus reticuloceps]
MRERLEKAYCHFALAMQTGAFVQLIILFVAICSRMSVLSSQLEEALQLGIFACDRLMVIIHSTGMHATTPQQLPSEPETSYPSHTGHSDVPSEDTGRPVSRCEPIDTSIFVVEALSKKTEATLEMRVTPTPSQLTNDRKVTVKDAQKARLKKAKKKFDEIDEIFGFCCS